MIVDIYVKARCDLGKGRYAVVIAEGGELVHKAAYTIGEEFPYKSQMLPADQYNTEIVAVCYGLMWCKNKGHKAVNIFCNTKTCQKWYYRKDIPEDRILREAFLQYADGIDIFADFIRKDNENEFNVLVNELASETNG